jgi:4-amino-4-deoxy-L-arabinose transferase-like glycosyltransferase
LLAVLCLALFLRIYKLPANFIFGVDEEYQAYLAQTIIKNFHIIWVGVSSTADFYLGPFWTYLTSGLLYFSKGDPLVTGYFAAFLGVATTLAVFIVGNKLYGYKTGILAAFLYSSLPLTVYFDQKYWNVSLIPMLCLVLLLSIYSSRKNEIWWLVFAFAYGLVFHTHLSLAPIGIVALIFIIKQRKKIHLKTYLFSLLVFTIVISPLIAFDYFHKWSNLTFPLRLIKTSSRKSSQINPSYRLVVFSQTLGRLAYLRPFRTGADETNWGCVSYAQTKPARTVSILLFLFLLWFLTRRALWRKDNTKILLMIVTVYLLCFLLFPGDAYEYYLIGLFPLFLFIPGILMDKAGLFWKRIIVGTLMMLSFLGVRTVVTSTNDYGLGVKRQLINEVMKVIGKESFELKSEGMCHIAEGWRYLFSLYGQKPVRSSTDQIFGWLYPGEITKEKAKYLVVMSESRAASNFSTAGSVLIKKGGFSAYIFRK